MADNQPYVCVACAHYMSEVESLSQHSAPPEHHGWCKAHQFYPMVSRLRTDRRVNGSCDYFNLDKKKLEDPEVAEVYLPLWLKSEAESR